MHPGGIGKGPSILRVVSAGHHKYITLITVIWHSLNSKSSVYGFLRQYLNSQ
jgi:hypothetical protein